MRQVFIDSFTWDQRHQLMNRALDADQAERNAIILGTAPVSSGIEDQQIGGVFDDDAIEGDEIGRTDWMRTESATEVGSGAILEELQRRKDILGDSYPFILSEGSLRYRGSHTGVYEFCLSVSLAESLTSIPYNRIPPAFERVTAEIIRCYLGNDAKALRTGWPSHDRVARPIRFKQLVAILNDRTGEWWWKPEHPDPDDPAPLVVKDGGVDFVAWTPMPDTRPGQFFVLGQCACGADWDTKLAELNKETLERWIRPVTAAPFTRAFVVPRHIPGYYIFRDCNAKAGITFDRARITLIAEAPDNRDHFRQQAQMFSLVDAARLVIPEYQPTERTDY